MRKGFTLIELLIVIAIIAILALIAIPNFLEAQVRAKISRVKSDMRSTATAIEAYLVDWNLIMGAWDWADATGATQEQGRLIAYSRLTTPIAYMTSFPKDPFQVGTQTQGRAEEEFQFQTSNTFSKHNWWRARQRGYTWGLNSMGPALNRISSITFIDVLRGLTAQQERTFVYDPTNGTVSQGFIIRTNKGEYKVDISPSV